jgi:hypothetical protein
VLLAPSNELAKVQGLCVSGQPAIASQERGERVLLGIGELRVDDRATSVVGLVVVTWHLQGQAETRKAGAHQAPGALMRSATYARSGVPIRRAPSRLTERAGPPTSGAARAERLRLPRRAVLDL